MGELIVIAVVLGVVVAALWPLARLWQRRRSPRDQPRVTGTEPVPPRVPEKPVPGSRPARRRHGKP